MRGNLGWGEVHDLVCVQTFNHNQEKGCPLNIVSPPCDRYEDPQPLVLNSGVSVTAG